jgi:hypothetical protein
MPAIKDLEIIDIRDANSEEERLLLRVKELTSLDGYIIINTKLTSADKLDILNERVYWFKGGINVNKGDIVRLYTRKNGEYSTSIAKYGDEDVRYHDFHWGLSESVWNLSHSDTVTVLHVDGWSSLTKRA